MKIPEIRNLVVDATLGVTGYLRNELSQNKVANLHYGSLDAFVEDYLTVVYPTNALHTHWCPSWWQHRDAVVLLQGLWCSFESLRLDGGCGTAVWTRDFLWPLMDRLTSERRGAFGECSLAGHVAAAPPLPCEKPPVGLFETFKGDGTADSHDEGRTR